MLLATGQSESRFVNKLIIYYVDIKVHINFIFQIWSSRTKQFRRGNALWLGCAIIIQPNIKPSFMKPEYRLKDGVATYIVCVYGAPHENFLSTPESYKNDCCITCSHADTWHHPCNVNSTKNLDPYPALCTCWYL